MTTIRTPARIIPRAFPGIKPEEVQEIIINSQIKSYPTGTVLCKEDEIEHTFYMILEGDFVVKGSREDRHRLGDGKNGPV